MSPTLRFGRWEVELYQRAVHVHRKPDPNCRDCGGEGGHGVIDIEYGPDWDDCHCLNQLRTWRLPYWPRRTKTQEYPF